MIWLLTGCFGSGTVSVPDAERVVDSGPAQAEPTPPQPRPTDTTPPTGSTGATGATGATGDTGTAQAACPGVTPQEVYFVDQAPLGLTPTRVVMGEVQGPGVVCAVTCNAGWVSGWWTVPAGLDPLPLPYQLAVDEHVELLLDVDHVGGLHDATCQAMVGGDLVVEVSVRQ